MAGGFAWPSVSHLPVACSDVRHTARLARVAVKRRYLMKHGQGRGDGASTAAD
jgi:hypothetical protein